MIYALVAATLAFIVLACASIVLRLTTRLTMIGAVKTVSQYAITVLVLVCLVLAFNHFSNQAHYVSVCETAIVDNFCE